MFEVVNVRWSMSDVVDIFTYETFITRISHMIQSSFTNSLLKRLLKTAIMQWPTDSLGDRAVKMF